MFELSKNLEMMLSVIERNRKLREMPINQFMESLEFKDGVFKSSCLLLFRKTPSIHAEEMYSVIVERIDEIKSSGYFVYTVNKGMFYDLETIYIFKKRSKYLMFKYLGILT